jgi:hypothetical protein
MTNFWEHMYANGFKKIEAGEAELRQGLAVANAASKVSTLEHYIWSSMPSAERMSGGKAHCAHFDFKAKVEDGIRSRYPDLAKKTTVLWTGFYPSNLITYPGFKPVEIVSAQLE